MTLCEFVKDMRWDRIVWCFSVLLWMGVSVTILVGYMVGAIIYI